MDRLPEDVLAGVLGRLDPRSLASCRCVCGEWRRIVEGRGLLLPRSLHGLFINYYEHEHPHLLSRPGSPAAGSVDGMLDFMPDKSWRTLTNHCNSLFVYEDYGYYVCNPTTRPWARLPPPWMKDWDRAAGAHLVFDPATSLHYEVVHLPRAPGTSTLGGDHELQPEVTTDPNSMEWPPAVLKTDVFSSSTGQWETGRRGSLHGKAARSPPWLTCFRKMSGSVGILWGQCIGRPSIGKEPSIYIAAVLL
ncbi:unnamed protein product [Urochloa humidicola]